MTETQWIRRVVTPLIFMSALVPAGLLVYAAFFGDLGVNPIETITHETGVWTLRFLLITLTVTPLRRVTGWNGAIKFRRMLGLFGFFYACLHFSTYFVLDHFFNLDAILADIVKRPYVTAGFTAFVLLLPLAITSTTGMIRRLGGKKWQLLHRLIYFSAGLGVLHYLWLVKSDIQRPLTYGAILATLLAVRAWFRLAGRQSTIAKTKLSRHPSSALTVD